MSGIDNRVVGQDEQTEMCIRDSVEPVAQESRLLQIIAQPHGGREGIVGMVFLTLLEPGEMCLRDSLCCVQSGILSLRFGFWQFLSF